MLHKLLLVPLKLSTLLTMLIALVTIPAQGQQQLLDRCDTELKARTTVDTILTRSVVEETGSRYWTHRVTYYFRGSGSQGSQWAHCLAQPEAYSVKVHDLIFTGSEPWSASSSSREPKRQRAAPSTSPTGSCLSFVEGSMGAKVVETSGDYDYWSWKVTVANACSEGRQAYVEIKFLDSDGFQLEYGNWLGTVSGHSQTDVVEQEMISRSVSSRIASYNVAGREQ